MPFFVQYDLTTGLITGTVQSPTAPGPMPEGRGQLEFSDYIDTSNKSVNSDTLELQDIPTG